MTSITRPMKDQRTLAEKHEAALLAAFRSLIPAGQVRFMREAKRIREAQALHQQVMKRLRDSE